MPDLSETVAVLGAGFSVPAGLPPASRLSEQFLSFADSSDSLLQRVITANLEKFWEDVFGYERGWSIPSFEDHFTLLDLAANVGHNLGHDYTPARLRALRRISIHRVFEILDRDYKSNQQIYTFLHKLMDNSSLVSLNWDIVVENHLFEMRKDFWYGIPGCFLDGKEQSISSLPLIKLHGSANWHYCDSCHSTLFGGRGEGKTTLVHRTFLEADDFRKLGADSGLVNEIASRPGTECRVCQNPKTTARVATFSYAKAFDFFPYHASWDSALKRLQAARRWVFIGYSLPDADFAFKHLLKTAQLAGREKEIHVVLKEGPRSPVVDRYKQFFGYKIRELFTEGFEEWVDRTL
jgi:hypothetical protein